MSLFAILCAVLGFGLMATHEYRQRKLDLLEEQNDLLRDLRDLSDDLEDDE